MADTPNIRLTFLEANQAQKHITVNEAFRALDALVQPLPISATPPRPSQALRPSRTPR
jgi:hypothetical protein